jgi:nucleotide-binding universal stress UspA family protein
MAIVGSYIAERFEAKNKAAASEQLDAAIAVSRLNAQHQVLNGTVYDSLLETADKLGADLIIIGAPAKAA